MIIHGSMTSYDSPPPPFVVVDETLLEFMNKEKQTSRIYKPARIKKLVWNLKITNLLEFMNSSTVSLLLGIL